MPHKWNCRWPLAGVASAALLATACTGKIGDSTAANPNQPVAGGASSSTGGAATCNDAVRTPGPSPLQRLTRFQYNNTVRDLLGDDSAPASRFPLEEQSLGFDNDATVLQVPLLLAEAYVTAAQDVATRALQNLPALVSCDPAAAAMTSGGEEQCAGAFIEKLGARAYRHPVTPEEKELLLSVYRTARAEFDFGSSVGAVLESMLMAPQFLYRPESTVPVAGQAVVAVDSWGLASRLSYFLWGTMPDDTLFESARTGQLTTPADVRREAERMWNDPRTRNVVRHFNEYWLEIGGVDGQGKDTTVFPDYTPEIGTLLRTQTETFVEHVYFDGDASFTTLMTAPYTYMNGKLASYYGVANGPTGDAFARVDLDPTRHAGVLTEGSITSWLATTDRRHPVLRGAFVRRKMLCDPLPPPPPNVVDGRGTVVDANATEHERLAAHRTSPSCSGCHVKMDPIGFGLENYDASGRWQALESGKPVDASGNIDGTDVAGPFEGPVELASKLASSEQVKGCLVLNWFRFANGRGETAQDQCATTKLNRVFLDSGQNIRELVLAMTQSDAFLYRTPVSMEAP